MSVDTEDDTVGVDPWTRQRALELSIEFNKPFDAERAKEIVTDAETFLDFLLGKPATE